MSGLRRLSPCGPRSDAADTASMNSAWHLLLPLLVHIQAQLDGDLALQALSRRVGLSAFQLHRLFTATLGETPMQYTSRLRLERAALRLLIQEATVLDIALDCGYRHHETFTRAFKRHFGQVPSAYRRWMQTQQVKASAPARGQGDVGGSRDCHPGSTGAGFELSPTKVVRLQAMHLAFVRHVGPYEAVPGSLFDELQTWATRRRLPGPRLWLGIGHDAPIATPPDKLRFDAALAVSGPFEAQGRIAYQLLAAGEFALTTHVGPFETLPAAYATIFPRAMALPGYELVGLPAVEIYRADQVDTHHRLNQTEICLPLMRRVAPVNPAGDEACRT
jgi:AraC family transcriptional regulator